MIKEFGEGIFVSGQSIVDNPSVTIPVSPAIDLMLAGGIPEGSFCISTGPPKVGKCLHGDEPVITPRGHVKIKDIKVGDEVCSPCGAYSVVKGFYPQGKKDIYRVTFSDGSYSLCSKSHLWNVKTRWSDYQTLSLEEILRQGLFTDGGKRPRWAIPLSSPVHYFDSKEHFIHPYLLGVILGDGSISRDTGIKLTSVDPEIVDRCNLLMDDGFYFKRLSTSNKEHFLCTSQRPNTYRQKINELNLGGTNSHTKFIPKEYLEASVTERKHLLNGLLDTDGTVTSKGNPSYSTTSTQLALDVKRLVNELGGLCKISPRTTKCNGKSFKSYRLNIRFDDYSWCFHLSRKREMCKNRTKKPLQRRIVEVDREGVANTYCISVTADSGLFLTRDCIVTHNTTLWLDFAGTAQGMEYANDLCPDGRHVYFFNIEGRIKARDLAGIKSLDLSERWFTSIQSEPGNILTAEKYLSILEHLVNTKPGSIFVVDSFSQLCSGSRMDSSYADRFRDDVPLMLSSFCKKVSNVLPVNKCLILGATHKIADQSRSMSPWMEASGRKLQYQMDVKLEATHRTLKPENNDSPIGQVVHWKCHSSSIGPPGRKAESFLRYNHGIDKEWEIIDMAVDIGIINKGGAWYTFPDESKAQGKDKAADYLRENPETYTEISKQVREMMGF